MGRGIDVGGRPKGNTHAQLLNVGRSGLLSPSGQIARDANVLKHFECAHGFLIADKLDYAFGVEFLRVGIVVEPIVPILEFGMIRTRHDFEVFLVPPDCAHLNWRRSPLAVDPSRVGRLVVWVEYLFDDDAVSPIVSENRTCRENGRPWT